jgi:hypothetical protein
MPRGQKSLEIDFVLGHIKVEMSTLAQVLSKILDHRAQLRHLLTQFVQFITERFILMFMHFLLTLVPGVIMPSMPQRFGLSAESV